MAVWTAVLTVCVNAHALGPCYDEYLRGSYKARALTTPDRKITHTSKSDGIWGIEYSKFDDKQYKDAYTTPQNRKIIRVYGAAAPALTVGFHVSIEIDSPTDELDVGYDQDAIEFQVAGEHIETFHVTAGAVRAYSSHSGHFYEHHLKFAIEDEIIQGLNIESGDTFSGVVPFYVDGEKYEYSFVSEMKHERRERSCIGVPGMP